MLLKRTVKPKEDKHREVVLGDYMGSFFSKLYPAGDDVEAPFPNQAKRRARREARSKRVCSMACLCTIESCTTEVGHDGSSGLDPPALKISQGSATGESKDADSNNSDEAKRCPSVFIKASSVTLGELDQGCHRDSRYQGVRGDNHDDIEKVEGNNSSEVSSTESVTSNSKTADEKVIHDLIEVREEVQSLLVSKAKTVHAALATTFLWTRSMPHRDLSTWCCLTRRRAKHRLTVVVPSRVLMRYDRRRGFAATR